MTLSEFKPLDQESRTRIALGEPENLFVEAGAGSGKTTALVGRIVKLVRRGDATMPHIAAITFTELAAGELRDRLRSELERAAASAAVEEERLGKEQLRLPEEQQRLREKQLRLREEEQRLREALRDLNAAAVQTIHGFCRRLLAENPLEAGLPPGFEMLDAVRASVEFNERWDALLDELLDRTPAEIKDPLERALLLGLRIDDLWKAAMAFHEDYDRLPECPLAVQPLSQFDPQLLLDELTSICGQASSCNVPEDLMLAHLAEIAPGNFTSDQSEAARQSIGLLVDGPKWSMTRGDQKNWRPGTLKQIKADLRDLQERREKAVADLRSNALMPLLERLRLFALECAAERRAAGRLVFHDLLVGTRDLLRDNPRVRQRVHEQFSHLFIDEFQDTDPLQVEIVFAVAGDPVAHPAPGWREAAVKPGRLFFVGDPKQSIYSFRRADVGLYIAVRDADGHRDAEHSLQLTHNFRSVKPVIDWVNAVFQQLMTADGASNGQVAYCALTGHREHTAVAEDDALPVHLLGGGSDGSAEEIRIEEGKKLARAIRFARDSGWADRLSDIALLIPTRTAWPHYERALDDAGIAYRVESKSLVYSMQEILDLVNVLRAIDDPSDEVAVVAALRTPAFGCSDTELFQYKQAGGRWNSSGTTHHHNGAGSPAAEGLKALERYRSLRWEMPVSGLMETIVRERRMLETAVGAPRPRDRWARTAFLIDQARAFDEAGSASLRPFLDWVERQKDDQSRAAESPVPEPDDDAVRVLTIHAAKGLEFPVVFLAGLNSGGSPGGASVIFSDSGPELRLGTKGAYFETVGYEVLSAAKEAGERAEDDRMLYVGATRAKNRLVVSVFHKKGSSSDAARLNSVCEKHPELFHRLTDLPELPVSPAPLPSAWPADTAADRDSWISARAEQIRRGRKMPVIAATAYAKLHITETGEEEEEERPAYRRGRDGTNVGRAAHSVLQTIDMVTREKLVEACRAQAVAESVPGRALEVEELVLAALDCPEVRTAISHKHWREVYAAGPVGDTLVEGFLDLLYETDRGMVIIDYKTDSAKSSKEIDAAMEKYSRQGAAYALALSTALKKDVADCIFLFLRTSPVQVRHVEDLKRAMSTAKEEMSRL